MRNPNTAHRYRRVLARGSRWFAATILTGLALAGCGGGGGNGSPIKLGSAPPATTTTTTTRQFVYATTGSGIWGFALGAGGALTSLTGAPFAAGGFPLGLAATPNGQFLYVTDGSSAGVYGYSVDAATGALTALAGSPFPASVDLNYIAIAPNGQFLYASGTAVDSIYGYTINATTGVLTAIAGSPFATSAVPLSVAVDPTGAYVYASTDSTVGPIGFTINVSSGALTVMTNSPFGGGPASAGDTILAIDPGTIFAYVGMGAGPGAGQVAAYSTNVTVGGLDSVAGSPYAVADTPYSVVVDGPGQNVFVGTASGISAFEVTPTTGALTAVTGSPFTVGSNGAPYSMSVDSTGSYLYTANSLTNTISGFAISGIGGLAPLAGSPFAAGSGGAFTGANGVLVLTTTKTTTSTS